MGKPLPPFQLALSKGGVAIGLQSCENHVGSRGLTQFYDILDTVLSCDCYPDNHVTFVRQSCDCHKLVNMIITFTSNP